MSKATHSSRSVGRAKTDVTLQIVHRERVEGGTNSLREGGYVVNNEELL